MLRALTYFDDAEADPLFPDSLSEAHWAEIKMWFTTQAPIVLRAFVKS